MNEWFDDFRTAVAFLTRLPMPHPDGAMPANFVRAHRMFPVVGALIGAAVGLLCLGLRHIGVPDLAAAALALGAGAILTGALHEDGLADVADGFGGGRDREAKLEIMRDSRLGTYGAAALMLSILARWACLVTLDNGGAVVAGLIAAHVGSRGIFAVLIQRTPLARDSGLAGSVGTVSDATVIRALVVGAVGLLFLGIGGAIVAALLVAATIYAFRTLCLRQIGGITGDTLGAAQQLAEIAILVAASALLT